MTTEAAPRLLARPMRPTEFRQVALLHSQNLGKSFFSSLGERYLATYYETFASSPSGIALTIEVDGRLAGYVVGTADDAAHYRWVIQNRRRRLAITGIRQLVARPRVLAKFVHTRALHYLRGVRKLAHIEPDKGEAVVVGSLMHIVVDPSQRGLGLGSQLVDGYTRIAAERGAGELRVLTRNDDSGAVEFYRKLGWSVTTTTTDIDGTTFCRLSLRVG